MRSIEFSDCDPAVLRSLRHLWVNAFRGLACLAVMAAGCSPSGPPLAEVTGLVTFNGRPANAEVIFEPQGTPDNPGGRPSTAYTHPDGTYRLAYTHDRTGAVIGPHRVLVRILRPHEEGEPTSLADAMTPRKQVWLARTVSPGRNRIHFAVSW